MEIIDSQMPIEKYDKLKAYIIAIKDSYSIEDLVAEVHNLYQDYMISEAQELELYNLVDPEDQVDSPAELWYNDYGCVNLWQFAQDL
jgi:hypothetical protein